MSIRSVGFAGRDLKFCGILGDAYFENVGLNVGSNNLFCAVLKHHLPDGSTLIDVGANIGVTTTLMDIFVNGAYIISIEPSVVFSCLNETVRLNGIKKQRSLNCCIGASDATVGFVSASGDSSASHIGGNHLISMRSLDSIADEEALSQVDFVKIDVEGFEVGVLDGMKKVNELFAPLIFMEFNSYALTTYGNHSPRAILERIVSEFGCFLAQTTGTDLQIVRADGITKFLHQNMIQRGCLDDILFCANKARIDAFGLE